MKNTNKTTNKNKNANEQIKTPEELFINEDYQQLAGSKYATDFENQLLEESLLRDGLLDTIKVCDNIILDGHRRYEICRKHKIPVRIQEIDPGCVRNTELWIINNRLAHRNLRKYQRIELALKYEKLGGKFL